MECQICGLAAQGNYFGATSCRACAAFFRRTTITSRQATICRMRDNCQIWKNKRMKCKKCRLDRCKEVGMDPSRIQLSRDTYKAVVHLPKTVEQYLGRPHFFLFMEPSSDTLNANNFVDCHNMIDRASKILQYGSETPIVAKNCLQKLTRGLQMARKQQMDGREMQIVKKFGKEETMIIWEQDFLTVTRWLTYFDDFQLLPHDQQMEILKIIWKVSARMNKLALTASKRRQNVCIDKLMMFGQDAAMDVATVEIDISWFTRYKPEQLIYFLDTLENWMMIDVLEEICRLEPSDVEMTYLMCQLCFQYAGKQLKGEMLDVLERFQEILANNLHDYYVNELKMPRYSGRLHQILKINQLVQKHILEKRNKTELAKFFGIWCIDFSHPEMFEGIGT